MENDANFKAAENQYRIMKRQFAKPNEALSAQGELSLSEKAFIACLARVAARVKVLEDDNKALKNTAHAITTKGHDE